MFVSGVPVSCKDIADKSNATEKQVLDAAKELQENAYPGRGIIIGKIITKNIYKNESKV